MTIVTLVSGCGNAYPGHGTRDGGNVVAPGGTVRPRLLPVRGSEGQLASARPRMVSSGELVNHPSFSSCVSPATRSGFGREDRPA
jgi:hypothetical protein